MPRSLRRAKGLRAFQHKGHNGHKGEQSGEESRAKSRSATGIGVGVGIDNRVGSGIGIEATTRTATNDQPRTSASQTDVAEVVAASPTRTQCNGTRTRNRCDGNAVCTAYGTSWVRRDLGLRVLESTNPGRVCRKKPSTSTSTAMLSTSTTRCRTGAGERRGFILARAWRGALALSAVEWCGHTLPDDDHAETNRFRFRPRVELATEELPPPWATRVPLATVKKLFLCVLCVLCVECSCFQQPHFPGNVQGRARLLARGCGSGPGWLRVLLPSSPRSLYFGV